MSGASKRSVQQAYQRARQYQRRTRKTSHVSTSSSTSNDTSDTQPHAFISPPNYFVIVYVYIVYYTLTRLLMLPPFFLSMYTNDPFFFFILPLPVCVFVLYGALSYYSQGLDVNCLSVWTGCLSVCLSHHTLVTPCTTISGLNTHSLCTCFRASLSLFFTSRYIILLWYNFCVCLWVAKNYLKRKCVFLPLHMQTLSLVHYPGSFSLACLHERKWAYE